MGEADKIDCNNGARECGHCYFLPPKKLAKKLFMACKPVSHILIDILGKDIWLNSGA